MGACLSASNTVRKSNALNEIRNSDITTSEYRLFCIYLAHFKMSEPDNNTVTFFLADYARIMGLDRPRKENIENQAKNILSRSVQVDTADGGFVRYSLFDTFKLHKENGEWLVTLECGHKIAPLIREERSRFIRYKLYNTIFLKSFNQQRIYELLKQYERLGERTIDLEELRAFLSVKPTEYPVWGDFSQKVLKVAQQAIKKHTDICFDYEPILKKRKTVAVKFTIHKNEDFIDKLNIDEFLPQTEIECDAEDLEEFEVESTGFQDDLEDQMHFEAPEAVDEWALFREVLPDDLTDGQIRYLVDVARKNVPFSLLGTERDLAARELLREKVLYMEAYDKHIYSKVSFLKQAIEEDWQ